MNYETLLKHGAAFNTFKEIHNLIEIKSKREYFNFLQCDTKLLIKKLNKKKDQHLNVYIIKIRPKLNQKALEKEIYNIITLKIVHLQYESI